PNPRDRPKHKLTELEEIRQALENNNNTLIDIPNIYERFTEFEEIRSLPKGKQPIRGPPRGKRGKSTKTKENSGQNYTQSPCTQPSPTNNNYNNNKRKLLHPSQNKKNKIAKITEQNSINTINTQLDPQTSPVWPKITTELNTNTQPNINEAHPGYLTLFIHYPNNPAKQPTDAAIIPELLKHRKGQIQINHMKPSETSIRCFTGAQIRAYKKVKINNDFR
ncbi:hypothetical protein CHS0354_016731, partial [Potamilus streckersoni]